MSVPIHVRFSFDTFLVQTTHVIHRPPFKQGGGVDIYIVFVRRTWHVKHINHNKSIQKGIYSIICHSSSGQRKQEGHVRPPHTTDLPKQEKGKNMHVSTQGSPSFSYI